MSSHQFESTIARKTPDPKFNVHLQYIFLPGVPRLLVNIDLGGVGFDIQNDGHRKRHPHCNLRLRYSFHSQYSVLFMLWVWGLILGPHSRQQTSDGNGDLRGVWVDGGFGFEKRV